MHFKARNLIEIFWSLHLS